MSESLSESAESTPDLFRPSKARAFFAAAVALASFFIPQEIPLEYYPLNNPGNDLNYLEITCAANVTSKTVFYLNLGRGLNELDRILWPIGPSDMAFTYTFPLWDAPLYELRLDPLEIPGELLITNFRIINRRNQEIVRFTKDSLVAPHEIASIVPVSNGWKIVTTPDAKDPYLFVKLGSVIAPVGMNHRNFLRCVLSTGYLAMMLWIILLAVFFAFRRPEPWRKSLSSMLFLALLALLFSFVGNRGLIRNSIHYAQFTPPPIAPGLQLELDVIASGPSNVQLFWDTGNGISESDSVRRNYEAHQGLQTIRFPLPSKPLKVLRFDPRDDEGKLSVRRIRVVDSANRTRAVLPLDSFVANNQIAHLAVKDEWLEIDTQPGGTDPILMFDERAVAIINRLQNPAPARTK